MDHPAVKQAEDAAKELLARKPELRSKVKDAFRWMMGEIEDEGSATHEVEMFLEDLRAMDTGKED